VGAPPDDILNDIGRNSLLVNRKKISEFLMSTLLAALPSSMVGTMRIFSLGQQYRVQVYFLVEKRKQRRAQLQRALTEENRKAVTADGVGACRRERCAESTATQQHRNKQFFIRQTCQTYKEALDERTCDIT
jgi:hypothetical protein